MLCRKVWPCETSPENLMRLSRAPAEGLASATQSSYRIALPMLTAEHLDGQRLRV